MLREGCAHLGDADARLGELLARNGLPPLRLRPPGFATLVHLILQQQVSRASAQAVFDRLQALVGGEVSVDGLRAADPADLRGVGFSQQKVDYVVAIADDIEGGSFDLVGLDRLGDEAAITALASRRGVGPWTASVYVLTALGRPDVWAPGDRALLVSLGRMLQLGGAATNEQAVELADSWRPWRAVAARILWHDYAAFEAR